MALRVSWASRSCSRSCSVSVRSLALFMLILRSYREIHADENALGIGKIADEAAQRQRQLLDESRRGKNLLASRKRRVLIDVNDFQVVAAIEVTLADLADIGHGAGRRRRRAGDVKTQNELVG